MIDLRSDTITRPTSKMLEAMMKAKVGDDVFQEDPTVNELEKQAAAIFGKQASIFMPSGTMSNQVAINLHTQPGDELICDSSSHIFHYEVGGVAFHSGVSMKMIDGNNGILTADEIKEAINTDNIHHPDTKLVSIENTTNRGGGIAYDFIELMKISKLCKNYNLKLHEDGARVFNALVAKKQDPQEHGKLFDSISVCLSKGLGAPAGTMLIGNEEFIAKARKKRKLFGGGMRQIGYFAAAGLFALENNIERLADDHRRAKELAETIQKLPYVVCTRPIETNIVIFRLAEEITAAAFVEALAQKGMHCFAFGPQLVRMVTHLEFTDRQLETAKNILENLF